MSKKPSRSLAAALQPYDRKPAAAMQQPRVEPSRQQHSANGSTALTQAPSRVGKKALIGYFDPSVSKQLKQMALDNDTSVQSLLAEALNDFFQKHKKPAIA